MSQTVLVADDSKTIRQIVEMALKASSWEVVGVPSAQDAMQAARQLPTVILLDYYMPDGSGYDVCRALKQDASTRTIPIVMLGGTYKSFDAGMARDAGADVVLMKPFRTDALLKALEEAQSVEIAAAAPAPPVPAPMPAPTPTYAEPEPAELNLDSESEEMDYGYGDESSVVDEPPSEPQLQEARHQTAVRRPGYSADDDDDLATPSAHSDATPLPQPRSHSQPRIPTEPARGSSPDIPAPRSTPMPMPTPVASAPTSAPSAAPVAAGPSREELVTMIREEVKAAVKDELPGLLRNVMGEIFAAKIMPKLTEHADARIQQVVTEQLTAQIQNQVRAELERLLSED